MYPNYGPSQTGSTEFLPACLANRKVFLRIEQTSEARTSLALGGFHGEAKTWHGLARAVRRSLDNMRIQSFLIAAAIHLKRLAAALVALFWAVNISWMRKADAGVAATHPA